MSPHDQHRLSKLMSLILRHQPDPFGLALDEQGWTPLAGLLAAIQRRREWRGTTEEAIREVVATSDKQRFEIEGDRIRARYGHSVEQRVHYPEVEPPELLYHGTSPQSLPAIRSEGLRSMRRQYVHLSTEVEQALAVGRRHSPGPVLLVIRARDAWQAGVRFYQPEARLYVAESVPDAFIELAEAEPRDGS
jgi:putative RNA 2'-phosphotransferase